MTEHSLSWTASTVVCSLPPSISRVYVQTPDGPLELLVSQPSPPTQPRKKAVLFQHGGFGAAAVWIPFMQYFSQIYGHPCYAASLRGHGASWKPGFFRMVLLTGKAAMARDLGYVLNWVQGYEAGQRQNHLDLEDIVLVGHSAGGGLAQYLLSQDLAQVGGLSLMGAFPSFGGLRVYWNWAKLDPYFGIRMYLRDFGHPRSPLSSTTLIHRAFFCPSFPINAVEDFEPHMPAFESLLWPLGMMVPFINTGSVLKNILGWSPMLKDRLFVMAGSEDTLMGTTLMCRMAQHYRKAFRVLVKRKILRVDPDAAEPPSCDGVRFGVIEGAGHHMQNDLQWQESAHQLLAFIEQL
ncbi:Alpha/Beta hydrolase protein [Collybia nuda]|uniref:Alpha/Beta hydrolase protein n=1 Tax=Collybia nuda TaxID=64659 RepID=A0A9P5XUR3_9AGAR|nr:Alpha/Beta hydrolase protein [Collybia nuda]